MAENVKVDASDWNDLLERLEVIRQNHDKGQYVKKEVLSTPFKTNILTEIETVNDKYDLAEGETESSLDKPHNIMRKYLNILLNSDHIVNQVTPAEINEAVKLPGIDTLINADDYAKINALINKLEGLPSSFSSNYRYKPRFSSCFRNFGGSDPAPRDERVCRKCFTVFGSRVGDVRPPDACSSKEGCNSCASGRNFQPTQFTSGCYQRAGQPGNQCTPRFL